MSERVTYRAVLLAGLFLAFSMGAFGDAAIWLIIPSLPAFHYLWSRP